MFLAAMPWTYWMALPLVIAWALVVAGFAAVYLSKVVEPSVRRLDTLAAARTTAVGSGGQRASRELAVR